MREGLVITPMDAARTIIENRELIKSALAALVDESLSPTERFDLAEFLLSKIPQVDLPIFHNFGDGIYTRECAHPMGSILTSVMHKYRHPFFLLKGKIAVYWLEGDKAFSTILTAPTYTMTQPGTRRIVLALEDTNAVIALRTDSKNPDEIMQAATEDTENPLLDPDFIPAWRRIPELA